LLEQGIEQNIFMCVWPIWNFTVLIKLCFKRNATTVTRHIHGSWMFAWM